ncbi:D-tyrosyl-tRNA deacylase-like protein [Dothidotthia symphoricarpi CBS 119687]|uniref:D-aminoacyl-tRNA deacylase n=1 Tax=Dothidotthia symphoricarpi CBS 119687 TaxID=1392245 RepID=A0A6A6ARP4_9PLEO|nr:D-tyrosyl-tRNA deacylase-like protein [Dothidotthia symphoricarpi CBS 119687]KAF2133848.1 D-tyrosyl-tRNA deacylase-like protein [Dothidotthia symphoricarpi CBS 119687]
MRTVLQRVKSASVTVDGQLISSIGKGLLVLAAISKDDTEKDVESMASKILKAKLWDDESSDPIGRWKCGVKDIEGEVLCVSQFTLLASMKKGNKPDFHQSASGVKAKTLYQNFFKKVQDLYEPDKVKDGLFAAMMDVALVNDGPVTIQIDTNPPKMDDPTSLGGSSASTVDVNDLVNNMTRITKEFQYPVELME